MVTRIAGETDGKRAVKDNPLAVCLSDGDSGVGSSKAGNVTSLNVANQGTEQLLSDILSELKKTNFHLSILTDNTIKNTEVN